MSNFSDEDNMDSETRSIKEFLDHTSVARHMSQPRSGCNNWLEDLIQLNSTLPLTEDSMPVDNTIDKVPSYEQGEDMSFYDFSTREGIWTLSKHLEAELRTRAVSEQQAFERMVGSRLRIESTKFSEDQKRPYFSYSTVSMKERMDKLFRKWLEFEREWQLASWLLHSGLSMGKINDFLALEIQKICEVGLNCYLAVHVENLKLFLRRIPQSLLQFSTGGIRLNASLLYSTILYFTIT
ncbi:hypothetical protein DFJ58DRAFT_840229 [Suillus subalutaceus]|uniref:uncharacterized protein n=1 Tax=Suillus subalutaceus TaxID=48586 RepID=UPI001B873F6C|nr:uncharacterized protein DFJ58DRAFT_840229 [Suillus subalutaceus]KAG1859367.1 hypothetical protein DFJ58DRAFT_840229 [Suillus subalutaceus]